MRLRKTFIFATLFIITNYLAVPKPLGAVGPQPAGTYYPMQFTNWPPLPANMLGVEAAELASGFFLLNDLDVGFYSSTPELGQGINPFDGDLVECLIYNQVLTAGQRSTTADYLRRKYNLW